MSRLALRFKLESFEIFSDPLEGWAIPEEVLVKIQDALYDRFPGIELDSWHEPAKNEYFFSMECGLPTAKGLGIDYKKEMEEDAKSPTRD